MLTISRDEGGRKKCLAAGCDEYINKPITKEKLLGATGRYTEVFQRKHERVPIYENISYFHEEVEYRGHIHIISLGGAFIMGERILPKGSIVKLRFSIAKIHDDIEVKGKVVWNFDSKEKFPQLLATAHGMGIKFIDITEEMKGAIARYAALGNLVV